MQCEWCEDTHVNQTKSTVYWELPDGSRAIEIENTPAIECNSCGMEYQQLDTIEAIEDQLMLIDTSKIESGISYENLLEQPRLLKRNYFKFD